MDADERGLFAGWMRTFSYITGIGLTEAERVSYVKEKTMKDDLRNCKLCESWRNEMLKTSPIVTFMAGHLKKSGFAVSAKNMPCIKCNEMRMGGFSDQGVIQLCYNHLLTKGTLETTIVHEMVHAYDQANFNLDWYNLEHHACTEIRAASLSGDCKWFYEAMRGNLGFLKHHQACVKRRAILSVRASPACKSEKHAEAAVNKVFKSCFTDTRPFDEIY
ncbi:peptidase M76 family-domain-containing protein [Coemansia spiralis]|nr:peptidase M76 family-domain-containing protein [Coemansia spiralis]